MSDLNDLDQPPPQYPGIITQADSLFKLPSFNDVMALYEFEDSLRLPSYSARPIRRYHPYLRFRRPVAPSCFDESSRYYNTIFDESYVPLEVPPVAPQGVQDTIQPLATSVNEYILPSGIVLPPAPVVPPPPAPAAECPTLAEFEAYIDAICAQEDQHQRRVRRLWHLLPFFINSVRHTLDADDRTAVSAPEPAQSSSASAGEPFPSTG